MCVGLTAFFCLSLQQEVARFLFDNKYWITDLIKDQFTIDPIFMCVRSDRRQKFVGPQEDTAEATSSGPGPDVVRWAPAILARVKGP